MSFSRSLKGRAAKVWEDGYKHPFVQGLGSGELDKKKFQFYLVQDYQYLLSYAKVFAIGALKADSEELMTNFSATQYSIFNDEMKNHREYMSRFGIAKGEAERTKPSLFNRAYTANMLAVGQTGGLAEVIAAVFPCAWTYYDYACRLKEDYADRLEGNFYKSWIETYSGEVFKQSFEWFYDALDSLCESKSEAELQKIADIFTSSVEFEFLFWDMSYKQQMSYDC